MLDTKLDPLPSSKDEWWEHSDKYSKEMPKPKRCEHSFYRRSGREVECKFCHCGFFVLPGDIIEAGHILRDGQKII